MYRILILTTSLLFSPAWAFDYPESRRDNTVDTYHEIAVPDPYQWLEDWSSQEVKTWRIGSSSSTSKTCKLNA